jgi:predicted SnoaL-like aldol condensation-catalyzing enzyme
MERSMDPKPETNRQTVLDFSEAGLDQKDFAAAEPIGDRYVQHDPRIADGMVWP